MATMTIRKFEETDWCHLQSWLDMSNENERIYADRELTEKLIPYRMITENGVGPMAMVGVTLSSEFPFVHIIIKPEARSMATFNAVVELGFNEMKRRGFAKVLAVLPHDSRIIPVIERKGARLQSNIYCFDLETD